MTGFGRSLVERVYDDLPATPYPGFRALLSVDDCKVAIPDFMCNRLCKQCPFGIYALLQQHAEVWKTRDGRIVCPEYDAQGVIKMEAYDGRMQPVVREILNIEQSAFGRG